MKGFNSGFVEIQTFEGEKFLKDLRPGDLVITSDKKYNRVYSIEQSLTSVDEDIYDIHYHTDKEGVLERISGDTILYLNSAKGIRVKDLKKGVKIKYLGGKNAVVDRIEKMDTINKTLYNIKFIKKNSTFYINNICIKGD